MEVTYAEGYQKFNISIPFEDSFDFKKNESHQSVDLNKIHECKLNNLFL